MTLDWSVPLTQGAQQWLAYAFTSAAEMQLALDKARADL